jgi:3-oxoisoapionate kinase
MTKPELEGVRPILTALRDLDPRHIVYKVCSTFDSWPDRGNIGRGIEIGAEVFDQAVIPVVPGAPALGRYAVFGNLFAAGSIASGGDAFRSDRHPVMSRHPVTPMNESDLVRHLALQTDRAIGLFDIRKLALSKSEREQAWSSARNGNGILLCDSLTVEQQPILGSLLEGDRFLVGSSGATTSLGAHWNARGVCKPRREWPSVKPNGPVLVVSGSCSPVTGRQIEAAIEAGWAGVDALGATAVAESVRELLAGKNTILHTSIGPDDPRRSANRSDLGRELGKVVRDILAKTPSVRRLVFAGGDTSSHALAELGIKAFYMMTRITPGAPLCQGDDFEIVCKGGQAGPDDFFLQAAG